MTEYRLHLRPRRIFLVATAAVFTLISAIAGGQQQSVPNAAILETEAEEVRRYSVEMIVFQYVGAAAGSTEIFQPEELIVPDDATFLEELPPLTENGEIMPGPDPLAPAPAPEGELSAEEDGLEEIDLLPQELEEIMTYEQSGHVRLDPAELVLTDIYQKLVDLDAYQPLMHTAWVQPTIEKDASTTLKLRRIGDPPLRLNGTVTLYLSRFLHLVLDLALEEKSPQRMTGRQNTVRSYGDNQSRTAFSFDPQFITPSTIYRIQEDRIVRNGELRYYDHPKFGVIAKITRIEEEEPEVELDTTDDLLPGGIN